MIRLSAVAARIELVAHAQILKTIISSTATIVHGLKELTLPPKLCIRREPLHAPRLQPITQALPLAHPRLDLRSLHKLGLRFRIRFGWLISDLLEDGHVL